MFQRFEDYETVAFVALALAFEWAERLWPAPRERGRGHGGSRGRFLKTDLAALLVLLAGVNLSRLALRPLAGGLEAVTDGRAIEALRTLPFAPKVLLGLVAVDFCLYWTHRAMHELGPLWRTHEWHHSVESLYWLSGLRTSLAHAFLYAIPQVLIPFGLLRFTLAEAATGFSAGIFMQFWTHSSARLSLGWLDAWIASPAYHRVHHSASALQRKNYGTFLTLWDRLFGTYQDPSRIPAGFALGLGYRKKASRMALGI